jgi:hypothetical protein
LVAADFIVFIILILIRNNYFLSEYRKICIFVSIPVFEYRKKSRDHGIERPTGMQAYRTVERQPVDIVMMGSKALITSEQKPACPEP